MISNFIGCMEMVSHPMVSLGVVLRLLKNVQSPAREMTSRWSNLHKIQNIDMCTNLGNYTSNLLF